MTEATKPTSKKTETIEIRVPFDVKTDLKRKANAERKTVSQVLRTLIANYLSDPVYKPKRLSIAWLSAGIAAILGVGLTSSMLASADTISLQVDGAFRDLNQDNYRSAIFSQPLRATSGEEQSIIVGDNEYRIAIVATETDDQQVFVRVSIYDDLNPDSEAISTPGLMLAKNGAGKIDINREIGKSYMMTVELSAD